MLDKLGRPEIVRIYGRTLNVWTSEKPHPLIEGRTITVQTQCEREYKDYDSETGELVAVGSEDFSAARDRTDVTYKYVHTWDGTRRNAGGYRWFECCGYIKFRTRDRKALKDLLKIRYPEAELIELR